MRFAIVTTEYPDFLTWLYDQEPEKRFAPYPEQLRLRTASLFGGSDFQSRALASLGHEAIDIFANNYWLQSAWMRTDVHLSPARRARLSLSGWVDPWTTRLRHRLTRSGRCEPRHYLSSPWIYETLRKQIEAFRPDVLVNQALDTLSPDFIAGLRSHIEVLVAWHSATPLPEEVGLELYDLGISSFPPTLETFDRAGITSQLARLAFDPEILNSVEPTERDLSVTFVGSFHPVHSSRTAFLEAVCERVPQLRVWGPSLEHVSKDSILWSRYEGPAWGRAMYEIMGRSRITLNHHGDVAPFANNSRLFEATGLGALLITDRHPNLAEIFEVGNEVLAYSGVDECTALIQQNLTNDAARAVVAGNGQQRTLRDYTYEKQMRPLVNFALSVGTKGPRA